VAVFLSPYRVDVSLNLVLLGLAGVLLVMLLAQRALSALLSLPREASRWRLLQKERAAHAAMLEAMGHFMAGRFLRARHAAESVLAKEAALSAADQKLSHAVALRSLAHMTAAESAHALQDKALRETHLAQALQEAEQADGEGRQTLLEGIPLRAARWLIDDRDAQASLTQLQQLPGSVGRRTVAMRLKMKAARLAGNIINRAALDVEELLHANVGAKAGLWGGAGGLSYSGSLGLLPARLRPKIKSINQVLPTAVWDPSPLYECGP
jgi:HemY protein